MLNVIMLCGNDCGCVDHSAVSSAIVCVSVSVKLHSLFLYGSLPLAEGPLAIENLLSPNGTLLCSTSALEAMFADLGG